MINQSQIEEIVNSCTDPDLKVSLGELQALKKIEITNNQVTIRLDLPGPIYWIIDDINYQIMDKVRALDPKLVVEIQIGEIAPDTSSRPVLPAVKYIICVASGKGGVGKSSLAANIAAQLAKKATVGLIDADVYGPSMPTMFGLKNAKLDAMKMPDGSVKAVPVKKYNLEIASMGFIMDTNDAAIVRGPMLAGYFSMLFEQIHWGAMDFMVFDMPPGTGDIQLTLTQKIPLTGAVIITTPQDIAVVDVRRSISMFRKVNVDILGVVENMSYFTPPELPDNKYYIFGEGGGKRIAEEQSVDFLGEVPLDIEMRNANDGGVPVVIKNDESLPAKAIEDITKKIVSKVRQKSYLLLQTPQMEISL